LNLAEFGAIPGRVLDLERDRVSPSSAWRTMILRLPFGIDLDGILPLARKFITIWNALWRSQVSCLVGRSRAASRCSDDRAPQ